MQRSGGVGVIADGRPAAIKHMNGPELAFQHSTTRTARYVPGFRSVQKAFAAIEVDQLYKPYSKDRTSGCPTISTAAPFHAGNESSAATSQQRAILDPSPNPRIKRRKSNDKNPNE